MFPTGQVPIKDDWQEASIFQRLYLLDLSDFIEENNVTICSVSTPIWHNRLGHLSSKRLLSMRSVLGFSNSSKPPCHVCPLAKQRRLSFPFNNNVASSPFDLIHCDAWGPFKTNGFRYFLTIVDDCSRYTWTYLMRAKSDALIIIHCFFKLVETQFSKVVKVF